MNFNLIIWKKMGSNLKYEIDINKFMIILLLLICISTALDTFR